MSPRRTDTERHYHPNRRDRFLRFLTPGFDGVPPSEDRPITKVRKFILGWGVTVPLFLGSIVWERVFHPRRFRREAGK